MTSTSIPDQLLLLPLRQRILEQSLGVRALHLHRAGHEEVEVRLSAETEEHVWSVSKTVTALAVGIAEAEGLLNASDPITQHLPAPDRTRFAPGLETVTITHLLTMTAGLKLTGDTLRERTAENPVDMILQAGLAHAPGTHWDYTSAQTLLAAAIVEAASGQSLRDYLMPRLFEPMRILNPQ